jgi:peptidoglycan hydrolase-like protein with peptidoglycan-binding domain
MLLQMLETGFPDRSFRVLQRECSRRREAVLEEFRERIAGLLAIGLVMAVPLYGLVSGTDFSLVEESEAAEPFTGLRGFQPPAVNPQAVLSRLETNELSPSDIRMLQMRLQESGFDPGPIDGIAGKRTLAALNAYRQSIRLSPVLVVSRQTIGALQQR